MLKNPCLILIISAVMTFTAVQAVETDADRKARQAELDAACEAARQRKLVPEMQKFIEECVEKEQRSDRAACERFYADYGERTGSQNPLHYDLPECVKAFEYQRSYRS